MLCAQELTFVTSKWDDSFREWSFLDEEEEELGTLRLKWDLGDDFSEWLYTYGDEDGEIKMKWRNDPNLWEFRSPRTILTARPVWTNDFRAWKINDGGTFYTLRYNWGSNWTIENRRFEIETYYPRDIRDWVIVEDDPNLNDDVRLFALFLAIYHSSPER